MFFYLCIYYFKHTYYDNIYILYYFLYIQKIEYLYIYIITNINYKNHHNILIMESSQLNCHKCNEPIFVINDRVSYKNCVHVEHFRKCFSQKEIEENTKIYFEFKQSIIHVKINGKCKECRYNKED